MKLRALVLIFTLGLATNGLTQDAATDVAKGVKEAGKATETTSKDAARATKSATKDAAHTTDKVATETLKSIERASQKTARASKRAGKKTGKEIGKGAEAAGKRRRKQRPKPPTRWTRARRKGVSVQIGTNGQPKRSDHLQQSQRARQSAVPVEPDVL
jgi:hypothetical protein